VKLVKWGCIGVTISLGIQCLGFAYLDKHFLATDSSIKVTNEYVEEEQTKQEAVQIDIPQEAKNLSTSFDGKYISYYENNILHVINTKTGDNKKIDFQEGIVVSNYKWIYDRNRMVILEKNEGNIKLSYYDIDRDQKEKSLTICKATQSAEVKDIEISTLTNMIYIRIEDSGKSKIYSFNSMDEMNNASTRTTLVGNMRVLTLENKLVYEDQAENKIYVYEKSKENPNKGYVNNAINIEGVTKPVLLSTDDNDNIFIGSEQDGKITDVYYGNLEQSTIKWKKQILAKPVLSKHLYVNRKGEIYLNDILKGELTNLTINKPYTYEGEVIGIYDTGFMTMNKNKITKNPFNK
jgi:hypothetical protein